MNVVTIRFVLHVLRLQVLFDTCTYNTGADSRVETYWQGGPEEIFVHLVTHSQKRLVASCVRSCFCSCERSRADSV